MVIWAQIFLLIPDIGSESFSYVTDKHNLPIIKHEQTLEFSSVIV